MASRRRNAPDERAKNVRDTLADQFLVGIVVRFGHPIATTAERSDSIAPSAGDGEGRRQSSCASCRVK